MVNTIAIIVAAGSGVRAGGSIPKQYQILSDKPLINHSIEVFAKLDYIDSIIVCIDAAHYEHYSHAIAQLPECAKDKVLPHVMGCDTRQSTVYAGLCALKTILPRHVMIHDAARPCVSPQLIERCHHALANGTKCVIPTLPVSDTLKYCQDSNIVNTIQREHLFCAQTPQCFDYATLLQAHESAVQAGFNATDDAEIIEAFGTESILCVLGEVENMKITHPHDFEIAHKLMRSVPDIRSAQGFDIHRFTTGTHIMLGGIEIPHTHGVDAHSDGDVILHALTDAILGLIAEGDIGQIFSNTDVQWKNAPSDIFVQEAMRRLGQSNGVITHCDIMVLCEAPKLSPYKDSMRAHIANLLALPMQKVSIKATTMEKLGAIGRNEGLAAQVLVTGYFQ